VHVQKQWHGAIPFGERRFGRLPALPLDPLERGREGDQACSRTRLQMLDLDAALTEVQLQQRRTNES
jgi:hypothetical protein